MNKLLIHVSHFLQASGGGEGTVEAPAAVTLGQL